ncbi:hypothetical protein GCM10017576_23550 [Microbacterium barkeri]|uniref:Uncharacterized protein n=1 Tax=Microbacterium barkeri TaxID=33917 RepID=A0A9W6H522_9MICO|nr:hypothetical protein [Microbacterium barkeri]MDI6944211.1 hypothetical protein [Microbacterium barkeri]MDR6876783.1 hypothetical protein [Microbacterium barkeri]GLJ62225.1 hypothetical protein GCM10017576_23550 [Microbacterium barkeri]
MALTHHLKNTQSPVRQFLYDSAPHFLLAGSRGHLGKDIAREFRFDELTARKLDLPIPEAVKDKRSHAGPIGTAFDYRVRMMLGGFAVGNTVALRGLEHFQLHTEGIRRGKHMARVLDEALLIADQAAQSGTDEDQDRLAIVLAWCESFYRAGIYAVVEGTLGKQLRKAKNGADLLALIDPLMLADLAALRTGAAEQVAEWNRAIDAGGRFEPNPVFAGSAMVGGADADWMIGDTLIDCKATERLTNPWIRDTLFQLLGYTLLDFEDALRIRWLGIWLPRRRAFQSWSLGEILERPADEALPDLRARFQQTLREWHEQMAAEAKARREAWAKWREEFEAEMQRREEEEAAKAEERRAKRREADRKRREAKKAEAPAG